MMERHITKEVQIGNRWIGGNHPIAIQSMTNTKTEDVAATVAQIKQLTKVGCEIIRCAVPTQEAAAALTEIKKQITIPLGDSVVTGPTLTNVNDFRAVVIDRRWSS
jgi:(E)-4-hydroxy-3-methylbut-2-enyl-diphosphate synthase